ncbi:MAG: N-acetylneuraminate synthase family protein, partial [Flavobacteriaceae bacterium]|nr:N-acetylneuraminate synthase family protein [Flavobacteriaceae bacterium]
MTTIAEIGQAHNGSIDKLYEYIEAVSKTGVSAIKFQTHIAEAESSIYEPFRVKFSPQDATRYDYWKRMEFSQQEWYDIGSHCKKLGLIFMSSPFSNKAVDVLEEAGVEQYKIGSGEVNNFLLLKKVVDTGKPIIVSSGMSSFQELDATVTFLKKHNANFSILQCTTSYPTKPADYGLNVIQELKSRYNVPVGFSDHSSNISTGIAAVALGAEIVEFHVVISKNEFGPDVTSSLTMEEVSSLVKGVENISKALLHPIDKTDNSRFTELKNIFEKSLAVNKNLQKGHILTFQDLEA